MEHNETEKRRVGIFPIYLFGFIVIVIAIGIRLNMGESNQIKVESPKAVEKQEREIPTPTVAENPLLGTWRAANDNGSYQYIDFQDEKYLIFYDDESYKEVEYEVITSTAPNQLYIYIQTSSGLQRIPFGIYKIQGDTFIWRDSIEAYSNGNDLPDFEMPDDFSQDVTNFKRYE